MYADLFIGVLNHSRVPLYICVCVCTRVVVVGCWLLAVVV